MLEQGPFQAQVLAQQGTLAQAQANVANARVNFQRQAQLLRTPAGQKQAYDNAQETAQSGAASVLTARGQPAGGADPARLHRDPGAGERAHHLDGG